MDEEWEIIGPLLPAERGWWARPTQDNRRLFEGMLWIARTVSQWGQLPDDYGKWNSVFRRFRRRIEIGVFDVLVETLSELVERERSADIVDTTIMAIFDVPEPSSAAAISGVLVASGGLHIVKLTRLMTPDEVVSVRQKASQLRAAYQSPGK